MIASFGAVAPRIAPGAYVASTASVVGDVEVGPRSSIWFGAVLRGDDAPIRIGAEASIQDNSVIHVFAHRGRRHPTVVGNRVTIGHSVTLHGCTIGDLCIVGMGSTVLDGAEMAERSMLAAGSLVSPGTRIPSGVLALGSPARPKRDLTPDELRWLEESAAHYVQLTARYLSGSSP